MPSPRVRAPASLDAALSGIAGVSNVVQASSTVDFPAPETPEMRVLSPDRSISWTPSNPPQLHRSRASSRHCCSLPLGDGNSASDCVIVGLFAGGLVGGVQGVDERREPLDRQQRLNERR